MKKDTYTQAEMDCALQAYEREKKLRKLATERLDKVDKVEGILVKIIGYLRRASEAIQTPRGSGPYEAQR